MMPKRFRDQLGELGDVRVWITNALGAPPHLDVRPDSSFRSYFARVSKLKNDPVVVDFKRYYFGSAVEVEVDAAGRILIPVQLRNRCGLTERVAFVGVDEERFQLWQPADLDANFAHVAMSSGRVMSHLAELGV